MERLSIEEVIGHCKRNTERHEKMSSMEELENGDMEPFYMKEYWEHRQVAEWLTELKEYRSLGTPEQLREVDKLYLEKCEEVNQLKAQLAAAKKCAEGDLISRSESMKKLREYADQKHYNGEVELANGILKAVCFIKSESNLPAAYDVVQVLTDLAAEKEYSYANFEEYVRETNPVLDAEYDDLFHRGLERAIKIVRNGGTK